jgi:hypothetical protein
MNNNTSSTPNTNNDNYYDFNTNDSNSNRSAKSIKVVSDDGISRYKTLPHVKSEYNRRYRGKESTITLSEFSRASEETKFNLYNNANRKAKLMGEINSNLEKDISKLVESIKNSDHIDLSNDNIIPTSSFGNNDQENTRYLAMSIPSTPEMISKLQNFYDCNITTNNSPLSNDLLKVTYANLEMLNALTRRHQKILNKNYSNKNFKNTLFKFFKQFSETPHQGFIKVAFQKTIKQHYNKHVFNPANNSTSMDSSRSSALSYNGIQTFRQSEKLKPYERGIIPSRSTHQRYDDDLKRGIELELITADRPSKSACYLNMLIVIEKLIYACMALHKEGVSSEAEFHEKFTQLKQILFTLTLDGAKLTEHTAMTILAIGAKIKEFVSLLSPAINTEKNLSIDKVKMHSSNNYTLIGFTNRNDTFKNSKM